MYVVIRRYKGASQLFDALSEHRSDVEQVIKGAPGFVSYYLVRDADGGAAITICQDRAGTAESTRLAAQWVRDNVPAASANPPEVTEGEVLLQFGA